MIITHASFIDTKSFFYRHDFDEKAMQEVFQQVRRYLDIITTS